jgi:hypothetical protein
MAISALSALSKHAQRSHSPPLQLVERLIWTPLQLWHALSALNSVGHS